MENILYNKRRDEPLYFERSISDYYHFCDCLKTKLSFDMSKVQPVLLCLGTDRMTGDCLGPLVGHKFRHFHFYKKNIFGSLEQPVHALNLSYALTQIRLSFSNPYIIVIDAALGLPGHIGNITLSSQPLLPGEGVSKHLPPVGDLSITGIVNSCHGNGNLLLQNTRLHLVNEMADFIYAGLVSSLSF